MRTLKSMRTIAAVAAVMLLLVALGRAQQAPASPDAPRDGQNTRHSDLGEGPWTFSTADYRIQVTRVVSNLDRPYGMAFLPDGGMLVTERPGRLRLVKNGVLDPQPISGVPKVLVKDFDGLEDVKLHPQFAQNHLVYLSYSKPSPTDGGGQCAIARGRYDGGHELTNVQEIFAGTGNSPRAIQQIVTVHLAWGKDGLLYATCATPNVNRFQAQDPTSHRGKVLRLKDDGTVPADNPLVGKTDYGLQYHPEIYTTGHRDGMSLAVHPETGEVFELENGPQGGDEINRLKPGANYGWPLVSYGREYSGEPIRRSHVTVGFEEPFMMWAPSISPSNAFFYTGDKFAKWKGNLIVSSLVGARIERVAFNPKGLPTRTSDGNTGFLLWELHQRIRQVAQAPDGSLYALTDYGNGALLHIEPTQTIASAASR